MRPRQSLAIARYAVQTNVLAPVTWAGLALLLGVALLGPLISLRNQGAWGFDPELLGTGFAFGALFVLRSGLVEHRTGGLETFLRGNLVTPVEHMAGIIAGLVATWLGFCAVAFGVALLLSAGDVGLSAWSVWIYLLMSGLLIPFALMVECVSDVRTPLFVPGFVYFAAILALSAAIGTGPTMELLGLNTNRAWPASSLPLALRTGVALVAGFAIVLGGTWLRARRRQ